MVQQKKKKKAVLWGEQKRRRSGSRRRKRECPLPFRSPEHRKLSNGRAEIFWLEIPKYISTIFNQDPGKSSQIVDSDKEGGTGQIAWPCVCACDVYDVIMLITRTGRRGSVKLIHILAPRFECCSLIQSVDLLDVFLKAVYCVHWCIVSRICTTLWLCHYDWMGSFSNLYVPSIVHGCP